MSRLNKILARLNKIIGRLNKIVCGLNKIHKCLNKIDARLWRLEQDHADEPRTDSAPRAARRVFKVSTSPRRHAKADWSRTP